MSTVTKQTHTPGPWREIHGAIYGKEPITNVMLQRGSEVVVASVNEHLPSQEANALLIAAAPEMLAALELLLSEMKEGQDSPSMGAMQKVYAAVCKAKGEV